MEGLLDRIRRPAGTVLLLLRCILDSRRTVLQCLLLDGIVRLAILGVLIMLLRIVVILLVSILIIMLLSVSVAFITLLMDRDTRSRTTRWSRA
jgi:hypothetical protein